MTLDVLGSYWTVCGPVQIAVPGGREWSLFDWPTRCAQARRVGLRGLGIWHADLEHQLASRSLGEIRQIFDDHGLEHLELEFLNDWFCDPGTPERAESDRWREMLWQAAVELHPHHIKMGNIVARPCELGKLTDRFGELCADAAEHHDVPLHYELMPFDCNAGRLDLVLRVLEGADAPNSGLALDFWHLGKLHISPEDLRRIPARLLTYVELSDGMIANLPDHTDETINHRRLPGEGEFDVVGYLRELMDLGYHGPWGVEVISAPLRALPMEEIFDRTYQTTTAALRAALQPAERASQ